MPRRHGDGRRCTAPPLAGWSICAHHRSTYVFDGDAFQKPMTVRPPVYKYYDVQRWLADETAEVPFVADEQQQKRRRLWEAVVDRPHNIPDVRVKQEPEW